LTFELENGHGEAGGVGEPCRLLVLSAWVALACQNSSLSDLTTWRVYVS
jgi:hypothetical protein